MKDMKDMKDGNYMPHDEDSYMKDMKDMKDGNYMPHDEESITDSHPITGNFEAHSKATESPSSLSAVDSPQTYTSSITLSGVTEESLLASQDMQQAIMAGYANAISLDYRDSKITISEIGNVLVSDLQAPARRRVLGEAADKQNTGDSTDTTNTGDASLAQIKTAAAAIQSGAAAAGAGIKVGAESTWDSTKNGASIAAGGIKDGATKAKAMWDDLAHKDLRVEFLITVKTVSAAEALTKRVDAVVASEVHAAFVKKAKTMGLEVEEVQVTAVSDLVQAGKKDSLEGPNKKLIAAAAGASAAFLLITFLLWRCCRQCRRQPPANANPHASSKPVSASNIEQRLDVVAAAQQGHTLKL